MSPLPPPTRLPGRGDPRTKATPFAIATPAAMKPRSAARARTALIGNIVLARFLQRPLPAVVAAVQGAEEVARRAGLLDGPHAPLRRKRLEGSRLDPDGARGDTLGCVRFRAGRPVVLLHSPLFGCEYVVNGSRLGAHLDQLTDAERVNALRALRTLFLASTRNRITLEVCRIVLDAQRAFLRTMDEARMVPLTGRAVAHEARRRGVAAAEASRVSRVLRSTPVLLRDGSIHPLRSLCPTSRAVLRARVRDVLDLERRLRARGQLPTPWSDAEIARRVSRQVGRHVSRRLVSYCRHALGVPAVSQRRHRGCYLSATARFSTLAPLDRETVLRRAPTSAGIYELRLARTDPEYRPQHAGVIYIGKANNLRHRLLTHATGNGRNPRLAQHIRRSKVMFRFCRVSGDLRQAETHVYRQFRETYGRAPECNRMHP